MLVLFCGISRDPEFYEPSLFVKHRPTFKIHFYSPIGEDDGRKLNEVEEKEELAYQEFVMEQKIYSDNLDKLWFLPPILIQVTLSFLLLGVNWKSTSTLKALALHFVFNLIPSTLITAFMLFNERMWQLLLLGTLLLVVNVCTIELIQRRIGFMQKS